MEKRLKNIILEHSDEIIKKWLEKLDQSKIAEYGETISQESIEQTNREFVNVIFQILKVTVERMIYMSSPRKLLTLDGH